MSVFPNWQKFAVHQRRDKTGCIPTCYEMMLRAADIKNVNLNDFQDEFDLDIQDGAISNNFHSVAKAVTQKYPFIEFGYELFQKGDGVKKLNRVEKLIEQKKIVLVSITNAPDGGNGWHIMPVVDSSDQILTLLQYVDQEAKIYTRKVSKNDFVNYHNNYEGGNDIAYLMKP